MRRHRHRTDVLKLLGLYEPEVEGELISERDARNARNTRCWNSKVKPLLEGAGYDPDDNATWPPKLEPRGATDAERAFVETFDQCAARWELRDLLSSV